MKKEEKMIYINDEVKTKIKRFNKNNVHIIADFDCTLTAPHSATSWSVFSRGEILGKECADEANALVKHYYPIELDENIEFEEKFKLMDKWWHEEFSLFIKYGLTEKLLKEALDKTPITFRDGVLDFLKVTKENNIPVIIISGGIGNIIEEVLIRNKCYFSNIYLLANFIEFKDGIAINLKGKMIHVLNKNEQALPQEISQKLEERPNVLLLGDMVGDASMTSVSSENVIKIGFLNQKVEENLKTFRQTFDIVCINNISYTELFDNLQDLEF